MLWRVKVHLEGVIRVEGDTPEAAERVVQERTPMLNDGPVFDRKLYAETLGPVEEHTLDPDNCVLEIVQFEAPEPYQPETDDGG